MPIDESEPGDMTIVDQPITCLLPSWYHRDLHLGDRGPDVALVQARLDVHQALPPSGVLEERTAAAICCFQCAQGLPATGYVDAATARALG